MIRLENVTKTYNKTVKALDDVSLTIEDGEFVGIIGHTGSGKSTLVQHLNGLLKATGGRIIYNGQDIYEKNYDLKDLRTQVGIVFQYPEHQLFGTTVYEDVCFGPKNQGLDDKEVALRAFEAIQAVGLPEECCDSSPFELSGGQKRRAAIAGVLAMKPAVLILDEPTAGLDPAGRTEILNLIKDLHEHQHLDLLLAIQSWHLASREVILHGLSLWQIFVIIRSWSSSVLQHRKLRI